MKIYASVLSVCLLLMVGFDVLARDARYIRTSSDELSLLIDTERRRMAVAYRNMGGGVVDSETGRRDPAIIDMWQKRYTAATKALLNLQREQSRRRVNAVVPLVMLVASLVFLILGLRKRIRERGSEIPLASGKVEIMETQDVFDTQDNYIAVRNTLFRTKSAAVTHLRRCYPRRCVHCGGRRDGAILGQTWKQNYYLAEAERKTKLGQIWAANPSIIPPCPSCDRT